MIEKLKLIKLIQHNYELLLIKYNLLKNNL